MDDASPTALADATRSVLLVVRLRPMASTTDLQALLLAMGITVDDVGQLLGRLELAGLVEQRGTDPAGWRLTDDGRSEGERLLALELDGLGIRNGVTGGYERFLAHNSALLRACTDWQLRDANPAAPVVNDHTDAAFDRQVIDRLGALHRAVLPICDHLTEQLGRFTVYGPRFSHAIDRINAGDTDAVDAPGADSYHAIWFELHDHLLATVGRDRSTEPLPEAAYRPPQ